VSPGKSEAPVAGPKVDDAHAEKLGRKASALPRFRWMSGMLGGLGSRVVGRDKGELHVIKSPYRPSWVRPQAMGWPDLRDPATKGCVLALVREKWPDARPLKLNFAKQWVIVRTGRAGVVLDCSDPHDTEAEALIAALEAAS